MPESIQSQAAVGTLGGNGPDDEQGAAVPSASRTGYDIPDVRPFAKGKA